jgi:hypothetical protein
MYGKGIGVTILDMAIKLEGLTSLLLDGFTIQETDNPTTTTVRKGLIYQDSGYYDYSNDITIRNCLFKASDQTTNSIPAIFGDGKLGGNLEISGSFF